MMILAQITLQRRAKPFPAAMVCVLLAALSANAVKMIGCGPENRARNSPRRRKALPKQRPRSMLSEFGRRNVAELLSARMA
jgi:hypothetical protein